MRTSAWLTSLTVITFSLVQGQSVEKLTFDVATIKKADLPMAGGGGGRTMFRFGPTGGPGTKDPGRVHYQFVTLKNMLMNAYDVKDFQVSGPSWLDSERFDIQATMPPETTKEQFRTMLQNLIADRFQGQVHRETKELPMYSLVVAKGGPKMKVAAEPPPVVPPREGEPAAPPPMAPFKMGADGFPILPVGAGGRGGIAMMMMPNRARLMATAQTMDALALRLSNILSKPVTDATELTAKYDFTLTYSPEGLGSGMGMGGPMPAPPPAGGGVVIAGRGPGDAGGEVETPPTIFAAIQSQMGLKLEAKKGPVELIVVDRMEKVPTEN